MSPDAVTKPGPLPRGARRQAPGRHGGGLGSRRHEVPPSAGDRGGIDERRVLLVVYDGAQLLDVACPGGALDIANRYGARRPYFIELGALGRRTTMGSAAAAGRTRPRGGFGLHRRLPSPPFDSGDAAAASAQLKERALQLLAASQVGARPVPCR